MTARARAGAVLYAKDMQRLVPFYCGAVGLAVESSAVDYTVLASPAFQLVVLQAPPRIAQSIEIERPPRRREGTPIKLVFHVDSIERARALADTLGGGLDPAEREWLFEGAVVCDGHDPEGNVFQLRQRAG